MCHFFLLIICSSFAKYFYCKDCKTKQIDRMYHFDWTVAVIYGCNRFHFFIDLNCISLAFFASNHLFWLKIETITWKLGQNIFKRKSFARCLYAFKIHFHDNNVRQIHFYGPLFVQLCSARTTALPPCNRYSKIFWWKKEAITKSI